MKRQMNTIWLLASIIIASGCGESIENNRSEAKDVEITTSLAAKKKTEAKKKDWFKGWDHLVNNGGVEKIKLPWFKTPKTINAKEMKGGGSVKLTDYWLRVTGWTTMWGHALENYTNKQYRTDGVRWDTPTTWVPKGRKGGDSGGNMTLMTQFGPDVPNYWQGATPMGAQTDWIFHVNYNNGQIREIFDRQHFRMKGNTVKSDFSEVAATSFDKAIFWSPPWKLPVRKLSQYGGPADFVGDKGKRYPGYTTMSVVNRYETFTVPPARNKGKDCPAAVFEDVIALRHEQWWYDATTQTSRGDFLIIYMAKGIGWIYQLTGDSVTVNARNEVIKDAGHILHMSPVGYIKQGGNWDRLCPHEFRDIVKRN